MRSTGGCVGGKRHCWLDESGDCMGCGASKYQATLMRGADTMLGRMTERSGAFEDVQRFIAEMLAASAPCSITHAIYADLAADMAQLARDRAFTRIPR